MAQRKYDPTKQWIGMATVEGVNRTVRVERIIEWQEAEPGGKTTLVAVRSYMDPSAEQVEIKETAGEFGKRFFECISSGHGRMGFPVAY